jgi:hypothetical protein
MSITEATGGVPRSAQDAPPANSGTVALHARSAAEQPTTASAPAPITFTRATLKEHANQRRYDVATHPAFPGYQLRVQSLTTKEVSAVEDAGLDIKGGGKKTKFQMRGNRVLLVAYGLVNDLNERIFNPFEPSDLQWIGTLDNRLTTAAAAKIRELSGMDAPDDEEDEDSGK